MNHNRRILAGAALAGLVLWALPGAALGQTTVTSGADRVVVDGNYVRIESPEGVAEVSGDWRTGGTIRVTDDVLVELGAVEHDDYVQLTLGGDILFDFGSARVTETSQKTLAQVAQVIRDRARGEVLVVGHTDSVGDPESNLRLSQDRAASVIGWLHRQEGIPSRMLLGRGLGESQPVDYNTTPDGRDNPAGRARNRRVEIFVGTTENADVRSAATVIVNSPEGEVRIGEGSVEVGGVRVDAGGVHIGGTDVSAAGRPSSAGGNTTCSAGRHCEANCPEGGCRMSCSAGATCKYGCSGGGCTMECAAGATCQLGCSGGDCRFVCALGSTCKKSCTGGGCSG